ncbi:DUF6168 family protein [Polaribacter aquimarinus]|uniref:Uncharacterized protein n=1 Tax=Polaribacter aquimarinus TaxID=2100726 RepID=A0A2U2JBW0_9FLAO|nr:DUF6168 family protein [Polaribacter aquimarinus]PWG05827.1 hypothetical protein DIS07_05130 [Polaribacter aquimarinus]
MIKSVLVFSTVFFFLFLISFSLHQFFIENQVITLPFSLKKIYLFHLVFSLLICTNFLLLSTVDKIFEQLGFIYLGTIVLKLVLFCIIFYKSIFTEENLSFAARISLFVPMIIFLLTEAVFVAKILQKKQ